MKTRLLKCCWDRWRGRNFPHLRIEMWGTPVCALSNLGMLARLDRVPAAQSVFAALHVDACAGEPDTFHAETAALLEGGVVVEFDVAARAEDAVPGQGIGGVDAEEARDGAMVEGVTGGRGNFAVRADFARRDGEDDAAEGSVAILIGAQAVTQEGAAHFGGWKDPAFNGRGENRGTGFRDWLTSEILANRQSLRTAVRHGLRGIQGHEATCLVRRFGARPGLRAVADETRGTLCQNASLLEFQGRKMVGL